MIYPNQPLSNEKIAPRFIFPILLLQLPTACSVCTLVQLEFWPIWNFDFFRYDANHKPEIAIPLGEFEALCAFRPYKQILEFFNTIPELRSLCQGEDISSIKVLYERVMRASKKDVEEQVWR